ncbi:MAG: bacillithiol biosynthesis cysteine-adding enzyme BshC [Gemmatimonadales bacterium]|nr:bacillithiol biosynthesis cysteine-adding enzyme BshC [Gemmatimonadales bacterium]
MESHPLPGNWPAIDPQDGGWNAALDPAVSAGGPAARLHLPGALAVTTGQQPGLFGGPMYTVHKAIAAAALAAALERQWGRPVVPIFWLAGDDHDWTEATSTAWWSASGEVRRWSLPERPEQAPQRSMRDEPLPASAVAEAREQLAADLPSGEARDETLAWIDRHWHSGATVHSAYSSGMTELFDRLGVVAFDATNAALKVAQQSLVTRALVESDRLDAALAGLPAAGTGITAGDRASLVFLDTAVGRDRLVRTADGWQTRRGGESFGEAELLDLVRSAPERFSANVLLRPVVEAALLPTVAYVAGPGEQRYLTSQAAVLYPLLGVVPQAVVARWGGTVIDQVSDRLLARLDLDPVDVIHDDGQLGREVLHRDFPPAAARALAALGTAIADATAVLQEVGPAIDPVLTRAVEYRGRRLMHVRDDLQRLLERHHRRRTDIAWAQYQRLRARLRPLDAPQERVIGVAGMLGRLGWAWCDAARQAADRWAEAAVGGGGR